MSIVHVLIQFVFRSTFGVALAMGLTSPRFVTSGFFRVHLWVLMGLNTLASLAIATQRESYTAMAGGHRGLLCIAIGLSVGSYVGAVMWLYELTRMGRIVLAVTSIGGICGAVLMAPRSALARPLDSILLVSDSVTSGALLGSTLTAMFLGHWYLNTPTMDLRPLRRLVIAMVAAVAGRMLVNACGLGLHLQTAESIATSFWIFVGLRWLAGLVTPLALAVMTWYALKIPNTQSATGILYAGVILTFIGELTSQFLSADASLPL